MTYRVVITENAKANPSGYYHYAAQRAPLTAARWLNRFEEALATLAQQPQRCGLAVESDLVRDEIRQLLFGQRPSVYRALFTIVGDEVQSPPYRQQQRRHSDRRLHDAGRSSAAGHDTFWAAVLADWNSDNTFINRAKNLRDGTAHTGEVSLLPQVRDDFFADQIDFLNGPPARTG